MGTNYYAVRKKPTISEPIHIGKSSCGWLFLFHDNEYWHTYPQVRAWLKEHVVEKEEYVILDEYDEEISYQNLIDKIDLKQKDPKNLENLDNFEHCRNIDGYRFSDREFS